MSEIVKRSRSGENHTRILFSKLSQQFDSCSAIRQVQKDIPHPFLMVTHRQDTEIYVVVLPTQHPAAAPAQKANKIRTICKKSPIPATDVLKTCRILDMSIFSNQGR